MLPLKRNSADLKSSTRSYFESNKVTVCAFLFGFFFWVLIPYIHLGVVYSYWVPAKTPVDRNHCTNTCWDTIFKGSYQWQIETGYKHVYFNITPNTFKIWCVTLFFILGIYESFRHLIALFLKGTVRYSMVALFAVVFYPHYYGWWSYFGYYNDEFYNQWNHQTFFTVTELVSTLMVLHLCNAGNAPRPRKLLLIICIAMVHVWSSGVDQFVVNILFWKGRWHQRARDVGFMLPDVLHLVIPCYYLKKHRGEERISVPDVGAVVFATTFLCIVCGNL